MLQTVLGAEPNAPPSQWRVSIPSPHVTYSATATELVLAILPRLYPVWN
jgi:hypothetical protein